MFERGEILADVPGEYQLLGVEREHLDQVLPPLLVLSICE